MKRLIIFIVISTFYNTTFASDKTLDITHNKEEATIPFIVDKSVNIKSSNITPTYTYYSPYFPQPINEPINNFEEQIYDFGVSNIKKIVKLFKEEVCEVNKGGAFEITLKADASGKFVGVGASTEGGLKISINCEVYEEKR